MKHPFKYLRGLAKRLLSLKHAYGGHAGWTCCAHCLKCNFPSDDTSLVGFSNLTLVGTFPLRTMLPQ